WSHRNALPPWSQIPRSCLLQTHHVNSPASLEEFVAPHLLSAPGSLLPPIISPPPIRPTHIVRLTILRLSGGALAVIQMHLASPVRSKRLLDARDATRFRL